MQDGISICKWYPSNLVVSVTFSAAYHQPVHSYWSIETMTIMWQMTPPPLNGCYKVMLADKSKAKISTVLQQTKL